jgi:uncharacterized protein (TIGR02117 family)
VLAFSAVYVGTALLAVTVLVRGDLQPGAVDEPMIFVCATPVHADILLPLADSAMDWRMVFPDLMSDEVPAGAMLAFGWGDLRFFRDVPEWSDLTLSTAAAALAGLNDVALRVSVVMPPQPSSECAPLQVREAARSKLAHFILATLARRADGQVMRYEGGSRFTAFFAARGRYSPFHTCNQWAANALAEAGLPHAPFAPFSFSVLWPLGGSP